MEPLKALDGRNEAAAPFGSPVSESLLDQIKVLWHGLRQMAHDQLSLVALEAKLAGESLAIMVAAGVLIAILVVSAWLGLLGAAVLYLVSVGVTASLGLLMAVAVNLIIAAVLYVLVRRTGRRLQFPATLRSLRPLPPKVQTSEQS